MWARQERVQWPQRWRGSVALPQISSRKNVQGTSPGLLGPMCLSLCFELSFAFSSSSSAFREL